MAGATPPVGWDRRRDSPVSPTPPSGQPRQRLRHVNKQADKSGQEQLQMARSDIRSD